ncbi:hypothetical protein [Ralstonia pickettii]|uniref:Uncharacterized protein n=1 Tax=Ralstonia pickettii TaxID=329 RepID=A0ABM9ISA7_RALPI|nr:hypothetical protein [Ralstonia pickettii]CAJ0729110.1 hypothetical protein R38712_03934 [Ralstonia pickettii]
MGPFADFDPVRAFVGLLSVSLLLLVALVAVANLAAWFEGRRFVAAEVADVSAWVDHVRWCRLDFFRSLEMRDEAYFELDGSKLDLADEFLREELHHLGGLAGAW